MRYSLLHRFQGCLLGAAIGGICSSGQQLPSWGRVATLGAKSLILQGSLELNDWRDRLTRESLHLDSIKLNSTAGLAIASLPVAMYFHENEVKLRQNLLSVVNMWTSEPVIRDGVLAVGYGLAQVLTEKFRPETLIAQTTAFIGRLSPVAQDLARVQTLAEQGLGLENALTQLQGLPTQVQTSIALAFYCFTSTPEDFRLCVLRAAREGGGEQSQTSAIIAGAFAGAYNSTVGIPATLQRIVSRSKPQLLATWGMTTDTEVLELMGSLLAAWSGVYDRARQIEMPAAAVAAPRVMRLR